MEKINLEKAVNLSACVLGVFLGEIVVAKSLGYEALGASMLICIGLQCILAVIGLTSIRRSGAIFALSVITPPLVVIGYFSKRPYIVCGIWLACLIASRLTENIQNRHLKGSPARN
jgi:hypothetical protein